MEHLGTPATERETIRGHMFRRSDAGSIWKLEICRVCGASFPAHDHALRFSARFDSIGGVCGDCLSHLPRPRVPKRVGLETMLSAVGVDLSALARTLGLRAEIVRQDLLRMRAAGRAKFAGGLWYAIAPPPVAQAEPTETEDTLFADGMSRHGGEERKCPAR